MPSARLYFSEDVHVITRDSSPNCILTIVYYLLEYLLNNSFDCKVNALQDSNEKNEKLIEEYQVTMIYYICSAIIIQFQKRNPTAEVKEKLTEQHGELSIIKEFAASGLQKIEILATQLEKLSDIVKKSIPEEALKNEEENNGTGDNNNGSAAPLPLPDYY